MSGAEPALNAAKVDSERPQKPLRKRKPLRRRVYWVLFGLRTLSCAPSAFAVWGYLEDARKCIAATQSVSACSFNTWLPAIWCLVSGYMTWLGLKGMIVRWVFTYSEPAAVFRVVTCVLINYSTISTLTHFRHSRGTTYMIDLQIWILISVILTTLYTLQTFITSDLGHSKRGKTLDLFHIAVYAVIPIGLASFVTMLALIRNLMLVQLYFSQPLESSLSSTTTSVASAAAAASPGAPIRSASSTILSFASSLASS